MHLSEHFTLAEFEASQMAARHGVRNALPPDLLPAAAATAALLERIRFALSDEAGHDVPVFISSGYRSPWLNAHIGGAAGSDHLLAQAADFVAPAFGTPLQVARLVARHADVLEVGQLIHEFGQWVHVSTRRPKAPVNRILTIGHGTVLAGIVPLGKESTA